MAEPPSDEVYLPPLEPCLKGETVVLSWQLVASALRDPTAHRQSSKALLDFLTDPLVQSFFTKPGSAFDPPDHKSLHHDAFIKKTAAIHVTPTPNQRYDINVIKEDALWLSKVAKVNELAALRVVLAEFQSRPENQLRGPISHQDVANLREAAGTANSHAANILPGLSIVASRDASEIQADFEKPESRKQRIFQTYLTERRCYAATNDYVFTLMLQEALPTSPATDASASMRKSFLEAFGMSPKHPQKAAGDTPTKTFHALASQYMALLPNCIQRSQASIDTVLPDETLRTEQIQHRWIQTALTEALHRMTVLFQLLDLSNEVFLSDNFAKQWFSLVDAFAFLDQLQGFTPDIQALMAPLQSLVCVISLVVLNLPRMMAFFGGDVDLDTDNEYLASSSTLEHIHDVLEASLNVGSVCTVPVLFAWIPVVHAMFSSYQERAEKRDAIQNQKAVETYDSNTQMVPGGRRRNSAGSITTIDKRRYDDFLINKNFDRDARKVQTMAVAVTDEARVYDVIANLSSCLSSSDRASFATSVGSRMRIAFLELLKTTYPYVGYKSEPVGALLTVLSGGRSYWDLSRSLHILPQHDITHLAVNDQGILETYFEQALNRFPYEFIPFLSLCRILYSSPAAAENGGNELILQLLERTPTLTFTLPEHFIDYQLSNEEDGINAFQLLDDLPLLPLLASRDRIASDEEMFTLPAGTSGRFVVDEGKIVRVDFPHSALALLGKRLEVNFVPNKYRLELGTLTLDEIAEIVSLFATLVRVVVSRSTMDDSYTTAGATEKGLAILAECSRGLPRTKDVISVVCDTLDILLDQEQGIDDSGLAAITSCIHFLHAVLPLCPGRVWSYMVRCPLLGNQAQGSRLAIMVGNLDLSGTQLELLVSATRLFSSLIDSAMNSSVQRKAGFKAGTRQRPGENIWLGISDKVVAQICLSIAQTTIDILESSSTWRFPNDQERMILMRDLVPILDKVIIFTFGMGEVGSQDALTSALEPAAKYVIDSFLAPATGTLRIQPLLATIVGATQQTESTICAAGSEVSRQQTVAVLSFATSLVRVPNYLDRSSTTVENQLFKATPFIARVCARDPSFRGPAIELLEALVMSAGKTVSEPPSLLGYLGPHISRSFLQFLSAIDKPFNQREEAEGIWRFFSTIVRNRQQWMANCLLTGKTPRDAKNGNGKPTEASSNSVLVVASQRLAAISTIDESEALAILDFITSAQNYWPWTIFTLQKDTGFLSELRAFVRNLKSAALSSKTDVLQACNEARLAAYIAEIFAMQLFHLRHINKASSFASELANDLDYFLRDGVAVSGYNRGLHVNFARNFSNHYPGCTLVNFKRTLFGPRSLGTNFYYALDCADSMLGYDPGWIGPRNQGFRSEMEKANANLSLVDAQVSLYHAWEFLLLELSTCLPKNDALKKQTLQVAQQCLEANEESPSHDLVFERLADSRVNLALILVQRVVDSAPSPGDTTQFLNVLWATISGIQDPYAPKNVALYRPLLKLLYVTLRAQAQTYSSSANPNALPDQHVKPAAITNTQTVLSILDSVVAKEFRTLVSLVHDSEASVSTSDVAMINAILQACLCIPGMDQNQTQILNILATHDAVHAAVSLYSWSDKLAEQGDPVYGELSLLFLLELSALPLVAEQLACDGLLNQITSASLATYLRRPNVSPFADQIGPQRCYSIWAKGIVPLLLNILSALGATIAPEVAYVLNQFPNLVQSSVERLEAPDDKRRRLRNDRAYITLLSVSEVHSLVLITRVLGTLRANNARDVPSVEWDSAALLENVEWWLDHRKALRERLVPLGMRESQWKTMPPGQGQGSAGNDNVLEGKVVDQLEVVQVVLREALEGLQD